jgi:hypothetical protein
MDDAGVELGKGAKFHAQQMKDLKKGLTSNLTGEETMVTDDEFEASLKKLQKSS